jgi:ribosomal protein S8
MLFDAKLGNTLSAIRVGFLSKHRQIKIPVSNYTKNVLNKLQEVGCIETFNIENVKSFKTAIITLAYIKGVPAYSKINLISTPSKKYTLT